MGFKVGEEFDFASPFDPTDVQKVCLQGALFAPFYQTGKAQTKNEIVANK